MNFKDAGSIYTAVESMRLANYPVARNRAKVNGLFNGNPPWSDEEAAKGKIFVNTNSLDATRIAHGARQNLDNAVLGQGDALSIKLHRGPLHKRMEWGRVLAREANKVLKGVQGFSDMWEATNTQVVLHGIGPVWWSGRENPIPREVGIEDVLVPAQTLLNFANLEFFAIYRQWTYAELWDMTHGQATDPGWNMPFVKKLLASLKEQPMQSTVMGNRWLMPEKLEEDLKENAGLFATSAAPCLFVWDFYFRHYGVKDKEQWNRRVVLDYMQMQPEASRAAVSEDAKANFLYQEDDYCGPRDEALHFQIGNCSNVAPFRYYSVRSLGFLLFGVCQLQNRLYCRFSDSTFGNLLELFRNVGEDDRERLEKVDLWHMGIVPDGLSFVTAAERHEINEKQVEMLLALNRQKMQESSSTWMPEIDTGTAKEQTLGEAKIRLQTSASLSNALLSQQFKRAAHLYQEICRRLALKGTKDKLAKAFQKAVLKAGVPEAYLDVEAWEISPARALGGGNMALEALQADKLMAMRPAYDAAAQRKILYLYTLANTDPDTAAELVPIEEQEVSSGTQLATLAFGTLMEGVPVAQKRTLDELDYVKGLLGLGAMMLEQLGNLEQMPGMLGVRLNKIAGMMNVHKHVKEHLAQVAGDPMEKSAVSELNAELVEQAQELAEFLQRAQEEMQAQAGAQGQGLGEEEAKLQAKLQAMQIEAQARAQIKEADAEQKRQHKDMQWSEENERRNATTQAEVGRKATLTQVEIGAKLAQTRADIAAKDLTTAAEIRRPKPAPASNGKAKK